MRICVPLRRSGGQISVLFRRTPHSATDCGAIKLHASCPSSVFTAPEAPAPLLSFISLQTFQLSSMFYTQVAWIIVVFMATLSGTVAAPIKITMDPSLTFLNSQTPVLSGPRHGRAFVAPESGVFGALTSSVATATTTTTTTTSTTTTTTTTTATPSYITLSPVSIFPSASSPPVHNFIPSQPTDTENAPISTPPSHHGLPMWALGVMGIVGLVLFIGLAGYIVDKCCPSCMESSCCQVGGLICCGH
jgi:hypothetical protein